MSTLSAPGCAAADREYPAMHACICSGPKLGPWLDRWTLRSTYVLVLLTGMARLTLFSTENWGSELK